MVTPVKLLNNRYKILQTLGRGGFGETFLAQDTHLPSARKCVIKHLKPALESSHIPPWLKDRFQREAAILEELGDNHKQIPELYAYFNEGDDFYLVQEWIPGLTLTEAQAKRGNFSSTAVEELLLGILPILEFVHQRRIIHRDIKPDNIILREGDGKPILIDFGIIKETMGTLVNPDGRSAYSVALGTPGYMASEQAAGRPVFSSDLYSLGLTAIFLLTGKTPQYLTSDSRTGEIIWREGAPQVSPTLARVLDQAIRYHPRERFSSASAMGQALFANFSVLGTTRNGSKSHDNHRSALINNAPLPEKTAPTLVVGTPYNANDTQATAVYSQEFTQYPEEQETSPLIKWIVMPLVILLVVLGGMAGGFWVTNQRRNQPPKPVEQPTEEIPSPQPSFEPQPKLFQDPPPQITPRPEPVPSETPEPETSPEVSEPVPVPETPEPEESEKITPEPEVSSPPTVTPDPAPSNPVPVTPPPVNPTPEPSSSPRPTTPNSSGSSPQTGNEIPVIPPPEKPSNDGGVSLPAPPAAEKPINPEQN